MNPTDDDDDEDYSNLRKEIATTKRVEMPLARGWSTPTFACHRNLSSCIISCCCPCVQFGLNQRMAFGSSGVKWTMLWMLPLILLYAAVNHMVPPAPIGAPVVAVDPMSMSTADLLVNHVSTAYETHVRKRDGGVGGGNGVHHHSGASAAAGPPGKGGGGGGGHHHGAAGSATSAKAASTAMKAPPTPEQVRQAEAKQAEVDLFSGKAPAPAATKPPPTMSRSTAFSYALPVGMALIGLVGAYRRWMLRSKYGIGGSTIGDFVCHSMCWCCSIAKEAREIRHQAIEEALAGAEQDLAEP